MNILDAYAPSRVPVMVRFRPVESPKPVRPAILAAKVSQWFLEALSEAELPRYRAMILKDAQMMWGFLQDTPKTLWEPFEWQVLWSGIIGRWPISVQEVILDSLQATGVSRSKSVAVNGGWALRGYFVRQSGEWHWEDKTVELTMRQWLAALRQSLPGLPVEEWAAILKVDGRNKPAAAWWRFWQKLAQGRYPQLEAALWRWRYMSAALGCNWVNALPLLMDGQWVLRDSLEQSSEYLSRCFRDLGLDALPARQWLRLDRDELLTTLGWSVWPLWGQSTERAGVIEPPQWTWSRLAYTLAIGGSQEQQRALSFYESFSRLQILPSTAWLPKFPSGAGMRFSDWSLRVPDQWEGLLNSLADGLGHTKWQGYVTLDWSEIRAKGARVAKRRAAPGLVACWRLFDDAARLQSRTDRPLTMVAPLWHADIPDLLREAWPDLRLALLVPDAFMRALQAGGDWSFWDPVRTKSLFHRYGNDYDAAVQVLLEQGVKPRFVVKASRVWRDLLDRMVKFHGPGLVFPGNHARVFNGGHTVGIDGAGWLPDDLATNEWHNWAALAIDVRSAWSGEAWEIAQLEALLRQAEDMANAAGQHEKVLSSSAKSICIGILGWTADDMADDRWQTFPKAWLTARARLTGNEGVYQYNPEGMLQSFMEHRQMKVWPWWVDKWPVVNSDWASHSLIAPFALQAKLMGVEPGIRLRTVDSARKVMDFAAKMRWSCDQGVTVTVNSDIAIKAEAWLRRAWLCGITNIRIAHPDSD